ncbi:MAG: DUF3592 domain-containing protein [Verrucomicrobiota bacterium]|jgi:hypothetical protein
MTSKPGKVILAICVGYGAAVWFSIMALRKRSALDRAKGWLSARGRILESTLYRDPDRKATHFRIRYEFHVGERIEGSTPRISGDWFWNNKQQAAFVSRYMPGQEVEVFYDPRDPKQNCLDRTDSSGIFVMWLIAFGGLLLASLLIWLQFY